MKTSAQWWAELKTNPDQMVAWLHKQYWGEVGASQRIWSYCIDQAPEKWVETLKVIAGQEQKHAGWIKDLLANRGLEPGPMHEARYWEKTLGQIDSFESAAAVAAHAEDMRLERIETIAYDAQSPADIRKVFQDILKEERFHAAAFKKMAGSDAMAATLEAHIHGREAIGLINVNEVL